LNAAPPAIARPMFDAFVAALEQRLGKPVPSGVFGAHMLVQLVNDGPVTIALDSRVRE
jgi:D-tyrosyl-tRNA(Tyr) deacylase